MTIVGLLKKRNHSQLIKALSNFLSIKKNNIDRQLIMNESEFKVKLSFNFFNRRFAHCISTAWCSNFPKVFVNYPKFFQNFFFFLQNLNTVNCNKLHDTAFFCEIKKNFTICLLKQIFLWRIRAGALSHSGFPLFTKADWYISVISAE